MVIKVYNYYSGVSLFNNPDGWISFCHLFIFFNVDLNFEFFKKWNQIQNGI